MTHVTVYRNSKKICTGFTAIGHAGCGEAGEDIVCAALSILLINTCNSIERLTEDPVLLTTNEEEGLIDFRLKKEPSKEAGLLLSAMILGLQDLEETYQTYIHLTFEEV